MLTLRFTLGIGTDAGGAVFGELRVSARLDWLPSLTLLDYKPNDTFSCHHRRRINLLQFIFPSKPSSICHRRSNDRGSDFEKWIARTTLLACTRSGVVD